MTFPTCKLRVLTLDEQIVPHKRFASIVEDTGVMRIVVATGLPTEALEWLSGNLSKGS